MARKIIQIFVLVDGDISEAYEDANYSTGYMRSNMHALCDDGTIWDYIYDKKSEKFIWKYDSNVPEIPQTALSFLPKERS